MTHDTPPPEWKNMTDWSDLPHVYVTKAECQQGMFWRIEACSVPMAIGPEVRLITASEADAMVAAALREAAAKVQDEANAANRDAEDAHQRGFSESAFHIRQHAEAMASVIPAIEALIPQPASAALDKLIAEAVQAERERQEARFADLLGAAHGLSYGEDWNNGTQAKTHGYREKLLSAVADLMGEMASPQAAAIRAAKGEPQ